MHPSIYGQTTANIALFIGCQIFTTLYMHNYFGVSVCRFFLIHIDGVICMLLVQICIRLNLLYCVVYLSYKIECKRKEYNIWNRKKGKIADQIKKTAHIALVLFESDDSSSSIGANGFWNRPCCFCLPFHYTSSNNNLRPLLMNERSSIRFYCLTSNLSWGIWWCRCIWKNLSATVS